MHAILRTALIPDLDREPRPDPLLVQLLVGPDDGPGEEAFQVLVYSSSGLARHLHDGPFLGRHALIVDVIDPSAVVEYLRQVVSDVEGESWEEIADQLRQIGLWEFEQYQEES